MMYFGHAFYFYEQLIRAARFDEIIIGALLYRVNRIFYGTVSGNNHDIHIYAGLANFKDQLVSAHYGHPEVSYNKINIVGKNVFKRFSSVGACLRAVTRLPQYQRDYVLILLLVIDNKDFIVFAVLHPVTLSQSEALY